MQAYYSDKTSTRKFLLILFGRGRMFAATVADD